MVSEYRGQCFHDYNRASVCPSQTLITESNHVPSSKTPPPGPRRRTLGANPRYHAPTPSSRAILISAGYALSRQPRTHSLFLCLKDLPLSASLELDSGLDNVDYLVSLSPQSTLTGWGEDIHGVLRAVPTKPPIVPANKLFVISCVLVYTASHQHTSPQS
jgi:hypothetical protein